MEAMKYYLFWNYFIMNTDKNWIPYSCPLIDEVIDIIQDAKIWDEEKVLQLMEWIRKINDDMRWICKDFYHEKEEEKERRLEAEKENYKLQDIIEKLESQIKALQE